MGGIQLSRGRAVMAAALAMSLAGVALVLALRGLDWATFQTQVRDLDWRWLVVAVVFDVLSYTAQGMRWRLLLQEATLWQATRNIYAGLFVNEVVPLRPGEAVRAWLATRELGVGLVRVGSTMVAERLLDGVWLAVALVAALVMAPLPAAMVKAMWLVVGGVAVVVTVAALLGGRHEALFQQVRAGLGNLSALVVSGGFLVAQGLAFWAVFQASHLTLGVMAAFVVMLVVRVGTMIPGAPANVGTHQFSTVLGLTLYGVPHVVAAGLSLVLFTVLTVPLLLIGFMACLQAGVDSSSYTACSADGAGEYQS